MKDHGTVDISGMTEVTRLVDEASEADVPLILRRGDEDVAILTPVTSGRKNWKPTDEQISAVRSAAGGWKDMDVDELIEQIYRDRENYGDRPPVEL